MISILDISLLIIKPKDIQIIIGDIDIKKMSELICKSLFISSSFPKTTFNIIIIK